MIDIVVCGYPRSGTTWLTRLVAEAIGCPSAGHWQKTKWPEPAAEGLDRKSEYRVWKSHWLPGRIEVPLERVLYIVRHPYDVTVSAERYFRRGGKPDYAGTYGKMRDGMFAETNWPAHVMSWLETGTAPIRYENLLRDAVGELRAILVRLHIERSPEELERAVKRQGFDKRKLDGPPGLLWPGKTSYPELPGDVRHTIDMECGRVMGRLGYARDAIDE